MLKNGPRLRETADGKPFDELVDQRTVFKILEECRYGYPRTTKKPGAAVALSIVLNSITGRPINHVPEAKRRDPDCGSPSLCLLSLGEARESESPAAATERHQVFLDNPVRN